MNRSIIPRESSVPVTAAKVQSEKSFSSDFTIWRSAGEDGAVTICVVIAVLGGLGAACCWAATAFCAKAAGRNIDELRTFAWACLIGAALVLGPLVVALAGHPESAGTLVVLAVAGALNVTGLVVQFSALRLGKVSVVVPLTSSEGAVAAVVAALIGKPISAVGWVSLFVVVFGVAATAFSASPSGEVAETRGWRNPMLLALLSAVLFGTGLALQGTAGAHTPVGIAIAPPTIMGLALIVVPLGATHRLGSPRSALPALVALAAVELLGFLCYVYGARSSVPVAAVLSAQYATISILVSVIALGERLSPGQLIGYASIAAGVIGLTIAG